VSLLVTEGVPLIEVFARELGHAVGAGRTVVARYEPDGTALSVGQWNFDEILPPFSRWPLEKGTVMEAVSRTKSPGRVDAYGRGAPGTLVSRLHENGVVSSAGCPITVGRRLWGVAIAMTQAFEPLPTGTEERMLGFVELVSAAIANAQSIADLRASRARAIAAADETRRRIEHCLHAGALQHLVSLALELRMIKAMTPPELEDVNEHLLYADLELGDAITDLQEISRGLHPVVLAKCGLSHALAALARRSAIAVELNVAAERRLPEHVEAAVYHVVSQALLNATQRSHASLAQIDLILNDTAVQLSVRDNGVENSDPRCGSWLIDLIDRVEALGGAIEIMSFAGGTALLTEIPVGNTS
jgi:signal transduction histidine kinase